MNKDIISEIAYHYIHGGYSNVWSDYDFYFIKWSEKMYISWVAFDEISHIHSKILNFLLIQNLLKKRNKFCILCNVWLQFCPLTVKHKIILCFTCENITFWKYVIYFSNIFLYFISLYITNCTVSGYPGKYYNILFHNLLRGNIKVSHYRSFVKCVNQSICKYTPGNFCQKCMFMLCDLSKCSHSTCMKTYYT